MVGGMSTEKQERLLKQRPQIVVATPGRLWKLMSDVCMYVCMYVVILERERGGGGGGGEREREREKEGEYHQV